MKRLLLCTAFAFFAAMLSSTVGGCMSNACNPCGKKKMEDDKRPMWVRNSPGCMCAEKMGGKCQCLHCQAQTPGSKCYCGDGGGCKCGINMAGCKCGHCTGKEGGDDKKGGCT